MNATDIRAKMEQLNSFILDAENSVRGGTIKDLTGLDKDVAVICTQAVRLPPAQAHDIQPLMAELIGNLERLSLALKEFKESVKP